MKRRRTSRFLVLLALLVISASARAASPDDDGSTASAKAVPAAAPRPNFVVIVTDDQASSTLRWMPHTRRLLERQGTSFERFFINDPICCPSRVTILLGQYRHNHRLELGQLGCSFDFYQRGMHRRAIGALLQSAGYRTGYLGKFLNSHGGYLKLRGPSSEDDDPFSTWDDYHIVVRREYFGFKLHENGSIRTARRNVYQTDHLARLATRFIRDSVDAKKPFFLFVATDSPHSPAKPAPRHENFSNVKAPRGPAFDRADPATQPGLAYTAPLTAVQRKRIDRSYAQQVRALQSVDELVRDLVMALTRARQIENTYLFYMSDNGLHFGEHRIVSGKGTPFEEAVRVPLLVRGPGVAKDRKVSEIVANVDILPTVLDLIGEVPDESIDGRSLRPLFGRRSEEVPWRHAVVLESRESKRIRRVPRFGAIRTDQYKWIEYEGGARALYDLAGDPHETSNVATREPAVASALSDWLAELLTCQGRDCILAENQTLGARLKGSGAD